MNLIVNWWRVIGVSGIIIILALVGYGAYQFYFEKPTPVINNYTVMPGATLKQEKPATPAKDRRFFTGITASKGTAMVTLGWLW